MCIIQQIDTPVGPEIEERSDSLQNEYENDFLFLRIKKRLLPLLLKPDVLESDYWTDVDSKEVVESVMNDILSEIREHREGVLSDILGVHHQPLSPNTKNDRRVCPPYKKIGIPLDNPRVHQGLLCDMYHINNKNEWDHDATSQSWKQPFLFFCLCCSLQELQIPAR